MLGPGAPFGALALLTDAPLRSAAVTALDAVETIILSAGSIERLWRAEPAVDRFLFPLPVSYLRRRDERLRGYQTGAWPL